MISEFVIRFVCQWDSKRIAHGHESVPVHLQGGMMQKGFTLGCIALILCIKLFLSQKQNKRGHKDGDVQTM